MASGHGVGSSKRRRGEGSGSGDGQEYPGDPPTVESDFSGVRVRVLTEIKTWVRSGEGDRNGRGYLVDINRSDVGDVESRKMAAAAVYDCAQLYRDPRHPVKSLNIHEVERRLRKAQILKDEDFIGMRLLNEYVQSHPVEPPPSEWKGLDAAKFKALKDEIKKRGLDFFKILKNNIAEVELARAGRQRQDEAQILPRVEENEPANLESEDKIKRLEDQIACMKVAHAGELRARDDQIADFAKKKEFDDALIALLLKFIDNGARTFGLPFFTMVRILSDDDSIHGYDENGAQILTD